MTRFFAAKKLLFHHILKLLNKRIRQYPCIYGRRHRFNPIPGGSENPLFQGDAYLHSSLSFHLINPTWTEGVKMTRGTTYMHIKIELKML